MREALLTEKVEDEGASGEEDEVGPLRSPGAGSLSADGSRAHVEGSMGAEGPFDLKDVVALLARSQLQMAGEAREELSEARVRAAQGRALVG